ncbi:MAG TPA: hypothetical protein VFH32_04125 [Rubrobacteraceae bacterium]|nr:hypothetical protein [Rubrobacteraceae bacterium]
MEDRGGEAVIGYMSIEEQVDKDFVRARHRALAGRVVALLRGEGEDLLSFDEVRRVSRANGGLRRGRREVEVRRIVGSVGRYRQFDRNFMPRKASLRDKWERVDRAFVRGEELPPVSLYKIGDAYFVEDGNHRVSVARYQGVEMIDAEVTELLTPAGGRRPESR